MIAIVLGAGATRGASFASRADAACLPPLDADFFTQLQRTGDNSYADLILPIVRQFFGVRQEVGLETVFSTLEQGEKLTRAGCMEEETEAWQKEFGRGIYLLYRGLQTVFGQSMVEVSANEFPKHRRCEYHQALVSALSPNDTIITFNYDCLIDTEVEEHFKERWNPELGYGFQLVSNGPDLKKHIDLAPKRNRIKLKAPRLLKLHGSMNFDIFKWNNRLLFKLLDGVYWDEPLDPRQSLIFPLSMKPFENAPFNQLWISAFKALQQATEIFLIGYSFPQTDGHADMLFRLSSRKAKDLHRIVIVNPDASARQRGRHALARRIGTKTKVIELNHLSEIPALLTQREQWIEMERFRQRSQRLIRKNEQEHLAKLREWQENSNSSDEEAK